MFACTLMMRKKRNLQCFMVFTCVSVLCLVRGTVSLNNRLVKCCINCIESSFCNNVLFNTVNKTCMRQGDTPDQAVSAGIKKYSHVQLTKIGYKIIHFRSTDFKIMITPRKDIKFDMQLDTPISTLMQPDCPPEKVKRLHKACREGELVEVKRLLTSDITIINCIGRFKRTPVLAAACEDKIQVVDLLIERGADLKAVDEDNNDILHVACVCGWNDMVDHILLLNITDIESKGESGRTPVLSAASGGYVVVVEYLITKGADFKAVDDNNDNILHLAIASGHSQVIKFILSILNTTYIESRGEHGRTPLMKAVCVGYISILKLLYKNYGAILTATDNDDRNVIHLACGKGQKEMLMYLVTIEELDGFERKVDRNGHTPLQVAKQKGYDAIVRFLEART